MRKVDMDGEQTPKVNRLTAMQPKRAGSSFRLRINPWSALIIILSLLLTITMFKVFTRPDVTNAHLKRFLPLEDLLKANANQRETEEFSETNALFASKDDRKTSRIAAEPAMDPLPQIEEEGEVEPLEMQEYYDGSIGPRYSKAHHIAEYEDLVFVTIVPSFDSPIIMELLRAFVGGIHQLRQGRHHIPRIQLFTPVLISDIPDEVSEEISWWNNVQVNNINTALGLPLNKDIKYRVEEEQLRLALLANVVRERGHAIWIKFGHVIEPVRILIYRAEKKGSVEDLLEAYRQGRETVMKIAAELKQNGMLAAFQGKELKFSNNIAITPRKKSADEELVKQFYKANDLILEGYQLNKGLPVIKQKLKKLLRVKGDQSNSNHEATNTLASTFGIYPSDPSSQAGCLVDIREEGISNSILVNEVASTPLTDSHNELLQSNQKIRRVAIAFPTTSKGLAEEDELVFFKHLLPSFLNTVTNDEYKNTIFTIYLGFDHGDQAFEGAAQQAAIVKRSAEMIGDRPVQLKMLQLPNARRVALLWNLMYLHALREGAEYFYQVNDDLTMKTPGWLTYFTRTLDGNNGFGVVGPADYHNGLNCSILTQSMVTPVHYDIFGMLYPIELKDWKSDRWLTYVYKPNDMHCRGDVIADNGGAPTRYQHCEFLSYIIYLEAGKRRIAEWKMSNAGEKTSTSDHDRTK